MEDETVLYITETNLIQYLLKHWIILLQYFRLLYFLSCTVSHDEVNITDDFVNFNKRALLSYSCLLGIKRQTIDFPLCTDGDDSRQSKQSHCHARKDGKHQNLILDLFIFSLSVGFRGERNVWLE